MGPITKLGEKAQSVIGGGWLAREFHVEPVQPLRYRSQIGGSQVYREVDGLHENTFLPIYQPDNSLAGHLEFMFKHERIHLEFLSRLFAKVGEQEITEWVLSAPTGRYSRRAAWFFEWITGRRLNVPDVKNAPYVDALERTRYWTAIKATNNPRWRIRDNMPGTSSFCPMVTLSHSLQAAIGLVDVAHSLQELETEFGQDLILRSAVWLTIKESRASFEIEGERNLDKTERFAVAMERYLGQLEDLFGADLLPLQKEILGENAPHYGLRQSPVFVGQTTRFQQIVHYVGPHFGSLESMLEGLRETRSRTLGADSLLRAAALSFAFVYLHPLADGNGRLSRFVINDVLRSDGVVPSPLVLPVSALIVKNLIQYDRTLDVFSSPFRRRYSSSWRFGNETRYADGIVSNFEFDEYDDAAHAWRFIDLSDHVEYTARLVSETIDEEMHQEASYIRQHRQVRERLARVIDAGDNSLDRIIRSIEENGKITGAIEAEFPALGSPDLGRRAVDAVLDSQSEDSIR